MDKRFKRRTDHAIGTREQFATLGVFIYKEAHMVNVAARTAQSFGWLPSIRQWIRRITVMQPAAPHIRAEDEQVQRVHLAFHCAYRHFAQAHPSWVNKGCSADFVRTVIMPRLQYGAQPGDYLAALPTGSALAAAWNREFGCLETPTMQLTRMAELSQAGDYFIRCFQTELQQLANS